MILARTPWRWPALAALHACVFLCAGAPALQAGEKYAVVVTGASGGDIYAAKYDRLRDTFAATLRERLGYKDGRVIVLGERGVAGERAGVQPATREAVQRVFGELRRMLATDDQLLVLLIGHGTSGDGEDGKFNLVGPDLSASQWADLLRPLPGRLVFVNTTGASFPFLRTLAGRGRIVITATDAAVQEFETVFPEFFVKAFTDAAADGDKSGRVSVWEAFSYASAGVRLWYDQRGQLPTERPLLDDTGAGVGREAQNPGEDGASARVTFLEPDDVVAGGVDAARAVLLKRRAELERALDDLRARKPALPSAEYDAALEKLLVDIATVSRQLRGQ